MTSGGIGKNELYANDTAASAGTARRWAANRMTQSYKRLNIDAV